MTELPSIKHILCLVTIVVQFSHSLAVVDSPSVKTFWAKYVDPNLHIAGRVTESQVKYVAEAGFKSFITLFPEDRPYPLGSETILTSEEEGYVATELAGLEFTSLFEDERWDAYIGPYGKFKAAFEALPKPVFFHCRVAWSATFLSLLYAADETANNPDYKGPIFIETAAEFDEYANKLGYVYYSQILRAKIYEITGDPSAILLPPAPATFSLPFWYQYWLAKPVYWNWYMTGQIRSNYLHLISLVGFDTIINLRLGTTNNGSPTQEEVTLLNIRDGTGTYTGTGRQTTEQLEANIIDPLKPNEYISEESELNYASRNELEFGDDIGYNEGLEREAVTNPLVRLNYYHTPVEEEIDAATLLYHIQNTWQNIGSDENVLVHCSDGRRALVVSLIMAGRNNGFDSTWAFERVRELGYDSLVTENDRYLIDLFLDTPIEEILV